MYKVDQWKGVACNCINKRVFLRNSLVVDSTVLSSFLAAPPLTLENVMSVVKGVRNWQTLAKQLVAAYDNDDEHGSDEDCLKTVVRQFLQEGYLYRPASWRAVIWSLYKANEIQLADQIRSYGEQLEGVCLCMYMYVNMSLSHMLYIMTHAVILC